LQKADFRGADGGRGQKKIAPNQEASQDDLDRVEGLLKDGIKSQATIIKMIWGLSKNSRKGSRYQRKVEVIKAIKSQLKV
jgi:hypothetical protein